MLSASTLQFTWMLAKIKLTIQYSTWYLQSIEKSRYSFLKNVFRVATDECTAFDTCETLTDESRSAFLFLSLFSPQAVSLIAFACHSPFHYSSYCWNRRVLFSEISFFRVYLLNLPLNVSSTWIYTLQYINRNLVKINIFRKNNIRLIYFVISDF